MEILKLECSGFLFMVYYADDQYSVRPYLWRTDTTVEETYFIWR